MPGMTVQRVHRGQRVRVDGHQGAFIVVRVDKVHSLANLELWDDPDQVLWDIPFRAMHLIHENVSVAA